MFIGLLSLLAAIGLLLILIIVHEAGHFFAARYFGMQTPIVGLGLPFFGPTWVMGKIKDVEFRFHPFLLGAYVAIPEMDDESANLEEMGIQLSGPRRSFPAWQRMIVSFAGPFANFVLAFVFALLVVVFIGVPKKSDNETFFVSQVSTSASAEVKQKLKPGDQLIGLQGKEAKNQESFVKSLQKLPNTNVLLWIQRSDTKNKVDYCLTPTIKTNASGKFNISLGANTEYEPVKGIPVLSHLHWAWTYFYNWFSWCVSGLFYLVSAPFRQDVQGPKITEVHGVILATSMIAKFIEQSASSALQWGALFSIELGIFNLIPMLPLDGGHILFQFGEMVSKGNKLMKLREYMSQAGLVLILFLACLIIFNDVRDLVFH
jgi:membrane-associated protease RseP (regulator of RpoE activity)